MTTAGQLCLTVLLSLLAWVVGVPGGAWGPCSSLVSGVLYGSFSLRDLFPGPQALATGCSWTVENPDPTKYSLYFRFNRWPEVCGRFAPAVLPLDHYLANQTCAPAGQPLDPEAVELCRSPVPHTFLQFDKNFVQLCLTAQPAATRVELVAEETGAGGDGGGDSDGEGGRGGGEDNEGSRETEKEERLTTVGAETLDFRVVEVLLINNENSSRFTCGVLCRWFEECVRTSSSGGHGHGSGEDGCSITQTGCVCPNAGPPSAATDALPSELEPPQPHTPPRVQRPPHPARRLLCHTDAPQQRHRHSAPGRPSR
ncbi:hypothetical protein AALO_G00252370 [Alosa alosa]|uniref:Adhesion G protein-coupled receptor B N-terminal domain-containing protein n=1 Tax=Alosa alosa TaxID=278164 RepID=A0AAV6FNK3_9TELE|nr:hypothetical protein AALO_G00252370 [Alosa alosa]